MSLENKLPQGSMYHKPDMFDALDKIYLEQAQDIGKKWQKYTGYSVGALQRIINLGSAVGYGHAAVSSINYHGTGGLPAAALFGLLSCTSALVAAVGDFRPKYLSQRTPKEQFNEPVLPTMGVAVMLMDIVLTSYKRITGSPILPLTVIGFGIGLLGWGATNYLSWNDCEPPNKKGKKKRVKEESTLKGYLGNYAQALAPQTDS